MSEIIDQDQALPPTLIEGPGPRRQAGHSRSSMGSHLWSKEMAFAVSRTSRERSDFGTPSTFSDGTGNQLRRHRRNSRQHRLSEMALDMVFLEDLHSLDALRDNNGLRLTRPNGQSNICLSTPHPLPRKSDLRGRARCGFSVLVPAQMHEEPAKAE